MDNFSYIALSRQMALHKMMDATAHNMANMSTPGFKANNLLFSEYLGKAAEGGHKVSEVQSAGSYRDLSVGPMTQTSNTLDFALQEKNSYFTINTPEGNRYTRAGSFQLNAKGEIVTKDGHQVMGENGPLSAQAGAMHITITKEGTLTSEKGQIGKLKIVSFDKPQSLQPEGQNLMNPGTQVAKPAEKVHVAQGMLEGSNVSSVMEMKKMIEIQRMYQSTQNMLNNDHDRIRTMIQTLTKTN